MFLKGGTETSQEVQVPCCLRERLRLDHKQDYPEPEEEARLWAPVAPREWWASVGSRLLVPPDSPRGAEV
jgi:hypothetical protein